MIPRLRRAVEQVGSIRLSRTRKDNALERLSLQVASSNQLVYLGDVGLVMLAVMDPHRIRGNDGGKCVFGIGQWRQGQRRRVLLLRQKSAWLDLL